MMQTLKMATLNINGIESDTRMRMLNEFLYKQDVDVALLQEVTHDKFDLIHGYNVILNIGTEQRGTAILTKWEYTPTDVKRIPSGRGMAAGISGICIINLYAHSGAEKRQDRERFFNQDILHLFPTNSNQIIMAGDFNCVLTPNDCTGTPNMSKSLKTLITGMGLVDAWDTHQQRPAYTHYTATGAARLDRIYMTDVVRTRKQGVEITPAAFTDHLAVVLHMQLPESPKIQRRFLWRMNITLLDDASFSSSLQTQWLKWRREARHYQSKLMWWDRHVKCRLRQFFLREGVKKNREKKDLENLYYEMIYQILRQPQPNTTTGPKLRELNAKLVRLNIIHQRGAELDVEEADRVIGEGLSIHQYVKSKKRRKARTVAHILDDQGVMRYELSSIMQIFTDHMTRRFASIDIDESRLRRLVECNLGKVPDVASEVMEEPITLEELEHAIRTGRKRKSPGRDGICHEFYAKTWSYAKSDFLEIVNDMYFTGMTDMQKNSNIVCIPKTANPLRTEYRLLTSLNTDYKLLTRITANRLRPWLQDVLHSQQYGGRIGAPILQAATLREIIAYAEMSRSSVCLLTLDFKEAFDRISHSCVYIYATLREHNFSKKMVRRIQSIYENASSVIQMNGTTTKNIPLRCSVRQGCPLSMLVFTMCINPLLQRLDQCLSGVKIGRGGHPTKLVAYVDDITLVLTSPDEVNSVQEELLTYEMASGVKVNKLKSKVLALGSWDPTIPMMNIPYSAEVKILGFQMYSTIKESITGSWAPLLAKMRAHAQTAYTRDMDLNVRIRYVHDYLMAPLWYTTQILPPTETTLRQIATTVSWFLWRGEIFRVPLSTLYKDKQTGGWGLVCIAAKCRMLFAVRMLTLLMNAGTVTARWLKRWRMAEPSGNPPINRKAPAGMDYLNEFYRETAYMPEKRIDETLRGYRRRVYGVMFHYVQAQTGVKTMRVEAKWPSVRWGNVWKNLCKAPVSETARMHWYKVIHDLEPTNEHLYKIGISTTDACKKCHRQDMLMHRLIECGEGEVIWGHARNKMAQILRTAPGRIPAEWLIHPQVIIWPPKRNKAILWIMAQVIHFRTQSQWKLTLQDYMDFMRRQRWKLMLTTDATDKVGNYLVVIGE
jgi:exonuclease III